MGNCVCPASRHDDDGEPARAAERGASCEELTTTGVKVTVRISKRELQKLMAKAAASGGGGEKRAAATVGEVLAEIVSASVAVDVDVDGSRRHRRSWAPTLQSIPEAVVES